jgi:hypothetical protein
MKAEVTADAEVMYDAHLRHVSIPAGLAAVIFSLHFSTASAVEGAQSPLAGPVRDDGWDRAFTRSSGWTGGDVAGSIDLGNSRTLWVFGDSWIGDVVDGKHAPGSRLVNNSIAVHLSLRDKSWSPPEPSSVEFRWGPAEANGRPTAWIVPAESNPVADGEAAKEDWYWPTGGGLVVPRSGTTRRLILFLYRVRKGDQPGSVMNFRVIGTSMAIIDNVDDPIANWKPRQIDVDVDRAINPKPGEQATERAHWGMAACAATDHQSADKPIVYIFGVRRGEAFNSNLVVARAATDSIEHFSAWQFYAGDGKWSHERGKAKPIADQIVSEFSVEPIAIGDGTRFLLVQSEPMFGAKILKRMASRLEGPWSKPSAVYTVSELERNRSYFTYAAKGHVRLSRPGELLVTYIVNSRKFSDIVNDAALYRPRFVRVPLRDTILERPVAP